jgi:uncharacterized protein
MSRPPSRYRTVEIRGFKWPNRATSVTLASVLGEDRFGLWLGIMKGSSWWAADRLNSGVFLHPFVKLVPNNTFWSACFQPVDPMVDVDIILPVNWLGDTLEEVDLELDVLRSADNKVWVRDQDKFECLRTEWSMSIEIAMQAENTSRQVHSWVEEGKEPFGRVGFSWLLHFLNDIDKTEASSSSAQA